MKSHFKCQLPLMICAVTMAFPSLLASQEGRQLRLTQDLRISAAEHDLSPIVFVAAAPNGTMAVTQDQDGLVRFFDTRGAPLGTFGRKGQGPGEFNTVGRLSWIADTLVVSDFSTRRFTLITPDRKLARTVPWLTSVSMAGKPGSDTPPQRIPIARLLYGDGSQLVSATFAETNPVPAWLGGGRPGTLFLRVDSTGTLRHQLGWSPGPSSCSVAFNDGRGGFGVTRIPFCGLPLDDASMEGGRLSLAYVEAGARPAYRVAVFKANGDTSFARTYSYQPKSISKSTKDSVLAARARTTPREVLDRMQIPEFYPPLSRLLAGRDETTWLELFSVSGNRTWHALDARGNLLGVLTLPRTTQLMVASRETIWAIEADDDGLQSIVRFRVTR